MFVKDLTKWIHSDQTDTEIEASYNQLIAQIHSFEQNRNKFDLISRCNAKQIEKFKCIQVAFEERIEQIKKDIENQQNLLKKAKVFKKNSVEYDLLLQAVQKQPCRKDIEERIDNLHKEIAKFEKEKQKLWKKLNFKVKQCNVLSTSVNALKSSLDEKYVDWDTSSTSTCEGAD